MKAIITLQSPTGVQHTVEKHEDRSAYPDDQNFQSMITYHWTDGNYYGCDCNRSLLTGNGDTKCGFPHRVRPPTRAPQRMRLL